MDEEESRYVAQVKSRVADLLAKARQVKQTSAISPALSGLNFEQLVGKITTPPHGDDTPTSIQHAALETASRSLLYQSLATHDINDPDFVEIWNLLDLLQFCADQGQCDPGLPLWLVEELLDSQTIDGCRRVFDYLESRREQLMPITNTNKTKQLTVLRCCNELLRRLSRAEDAVFCGRVFIFLFQSFPLGDKSSVNLRGEFHVENSTAFDPPKEPGSVDDNMDVDVQEGQEGPKTTATKDAPSSGQDADKSGNSEDHKDKERAVDMDELYTTFWSLQSAFSNPIKLFAPEELKSFKSGMEATIEKFKSVPKVQTHGAKSEPQRGIKRRKMGDNDDFASNFNPKYLTSRDLFDLEISDLTFQRHILVQALILIDFLLSQTPKAKKKLTELKAQRALTYDFVLGDEDEAWAAATREAIATYLQEGPDGKFYFRMVDNVLSRDKNWVRWKIESCPPIEKAPVPTKDFLAARDGARKACAIRRLKSQPMGALDLSFLSDTENLNGFDKLRRRERYAVPSIESLLHDIANSDLDLEMAGSEKERQTLQEARSIKTWRALRVASKVKLNAFDKVDERRTETLKVLSDSQPADTEAANGPSTNGAQTKHSKDAGDAQDGVETAGDASEHRDTVMSVPVVEDALSTAEVPTDAGVN